MYANGSFFRLYALMLAVLVAVPVPALADDIGWPFRGPWEEISAVGKGDDETPGGSGSDDSDSDDSGDSTTPGGGSSAPGPKGPGGGVASYIDGKILWSWWWEHNKDRFLARATERGRVNAGSIQYWFGAGAKYPPRDINPVSEKHRRSIYEELVRRLNDRAGNGVRRAACIALGRLHHIPANEKEKEDSAKDADVSDNMCARQLVGVIRKTKDAEVRASALLGLGMTGDAKGCQALLRLYDSGLPKESKGYALIAFGLARFPDALELIVESMPKSAAKKTETGISAVHALGLYGPAWVEEIEKHKTADGARDGIKHLVQLASKSSRGEVIPTQALTALGRLQTGLSAVKKASTNKSVSISWTAILALANYSSSESDAKDAAKQLTTSAYRGLHQTQNFCILAAGDLASRLNPNSKARAYILKWLKGKKQLGSNDNYTRASAAIALGVANDRTAAPKIADLLQQTTIDHWVAGACTIALGLLKEADYADLVMARVVKGKFDNDARGYGLVGLALMGDTTRIDEISVLAKTTQQYEIDRMVPLALGVLGDRRHTRALTNYFKTKFKTKRRVAVSNAAFGLTWIRDDASVDALIDLAESSSEPEVRGMATIALGYVGSPVRVSELTRCIVSTNHRKRFSGWTTLFRISMIL